MPEYGLRAVGSEIPKWCNRNGAIRGVPSKRMEGNGMRRTTVFAGWLHAGLIIIAAGVTLLADDKKPAPAPAPRPAAPAPAPAPRPAAAAPAPRQATPPPASRPSAPPVQPAPRQAPSPQVPRQAPPAQSAPRETPSPQTPRQTPAQQNPISGRTPSERTTTGTGRTPSERTTTGTGRTPSDRTTTGSGRTPTPKTAESPRRGDSTNPGVGRPNDGRSNGGNRNQNPSTAGNSRQGATGRVGTAGNSRPASTRNGAQVSTRAGGASTYRTSDRQTVARINNGRVSHVERPGTVIRRPAGGSRTVIVQRPGNRVVMARSGGHGYVQRPVVVGRHTYAQRTYYVNRVAYVRAYRPAMYHGVAMSYYAPSYYYPSSFYGWASSPWDVPVNYAWGWGGDPWYGYYGRYFSPYPVYARPSLWLTDYMIANTLQSAFRARAEARAEARAYAQSGDEGADQAEYTATNAPMSDEVKRLIEQEVRRQLAEAKLEVRESKGSNDALPPSLHEKGTHLFLAGDSLEVENHSTGDTCTIGEGDAIEMNGAFPKNGKNINVLVRASKDSSCAANSTVSVAMTDLVEMHNHMRETIEQGMKALRERQGKDNLPFLPADAAGEPRLTAFAASMQPDSDVAGVIASESSQADQLESSVLADFNTAASGPSAVETEVSVNEPAPPSVRQVDNREAGLLASIQTGQTESQVIAIMGQPLSMSFLGGLKKQHEYRAGKVSFTDGEVSEVEQFTAGGSTQSQAPPAPAPAQTRAPSKVSATPASPQPPARRQNNGGVAMGLSESEVIGILGQPSNVSFLGGLKKMYEYRDRKVIFTDGNVSEVQ